MYIYICIYVQLAQEKGGIFNKSYLPITSTQISFHLPPPLSFSVTVNIDESDYFLRVSLNCNIL